jgi:hypothetical protein
MFVTGMTEKVMLDLKIKPVKFPFTCTDECRDPRGLTS